MPSFTSDGYKLLKTPSQLQAVIIKNRNYCNISLEDCQTDTPINNCMRIKADGTHGKCTVNSQIQPAVLIKVVTFLSQFYLVK